ncbi:MAG TPA: M13 family metallopeptidase [Acidobacteriaceae bacterium]|jgi:endothelin-converting enzyme/putative endopeptidase|nr:M13 family metallopeptidase [Acidobacteriaceae bacterium]
MNLSSARRLWLRSGSLFLTSAFLFTAAEALPQNATSATDSSQVHGIAVANMDPAVNPGDNFYLYSNGGWIDRTQIPADRAGLSVFSALLDRSNKEVAGIIEEAAKSNPPAGSNARKIADVYNAYMDEKTIDALGIKPLQPHLDAIAAIHDRHDLAMALGRTLRADVDLLNNAVFSTPNFLGLWVAPGFADSDHYVPYLLQGGLAMPSPSYYLDDSERMKEVRAKYVTHVAAMLKFAGLDDTDARAARVVALEHAIAQVHIPLSEIEDIAKANNLWHRSDFVSKAPGLDWNAYFEGADLAQQQEFMVWTPTALTGEAALAASTPIDTWKDWLAFHLIDHYASVLAKPIADEDFAFSGTTLSGIQQQRPRWQLAVGTVNGYLGDAVGQIYAKQYFPPEAKAEAQAMVANLIAAYHKRLDAISWLAPSTRAEAHAKLDTLYVGIGYPETWKDYSAYEVRADDAFGNAWRHGLWYYHDQIARIGKPVDRHEWSMTPQTVNAVNLPLQNALNFPAAILQPPFFDPKAPAAHNYGAIGTVIGHEISHTFDAEGSAFDSKGRVRNWWTPADHAHFEEQAQKLIEQYDAYELFPGLHVNGKQTIDENIADLGGVAAAYDGYHASLHGQPPPMQDGFTGDQQFYISFGQNWASKAREASLRRQVLTDSHSPGQFRADMVRNSDAWYKAFDVKPGETLYLAPENRIRIW